MQFSALTQTPLFSHQSSEPLFCLFFSSATSLMQPGETLPCAVPFTAVQAPDSQFVLLVLLSKSCFLPQEDDALSVLPAGTGRKRGCLQK